MGTSGYFDFVGFTAMAFLFSCEKGDPFAVKKNGITKRT